MIILQFALFAAALAFSAALPDFILNGVKKMQILEKDVSNVIAKTKNLAKNNFRDHTFFNYLRTNFKDSHSGTVLGVSKFKWQDCGSGSELLHIYDFVLTPDPLVIPGNIGLQFDVILKQTLDAPLKVAIKLEKYIWPVWITVPCIDDIGSCTYDNFCDRLSLEVCPKSFNDHHIPCKCPFPQNNYTLPMSSFNVDVGHIPSGEYYVKAEASYQSKDIICLEMYFSIG